MSYLDRNKSNSQFQQQSGNKYDMFDELNNFRTNLRNKLMGRGSTHNSSNQQSNIQQCSPQKTNNTLQNSFSAKKNLTINTEMQSTNKINKFRNFLSPTSQAPKMYNTSTMKHASSQQQIGVNQGKTSFPVSPNLNSIFREYTIESTIRNSPIKQQSLQVPSPFQTAQLSKKPPQAQNIQKIIESQKIKSSQSIANLHKTYKEQLKFKNISQLIPVSKIVEIQDMLIDLNQAQFQEIPKAYIEELVKLSSIINFQVKTYQFNAKQSQ